MRIPVVKVLPISRVSERRQKSVSVIEAETGAEIRFPLSQIQLWPGRIVIPAWLYQKMGIDDVLRKIPRDH
jgi:hypothetical protein